MVKKSKQNSRRRRNTMFIHKLLREKEIEVINHSSYDLDIEVVGVPVAKDMMKREQNLSILGVVKRQTTTSGIQQQTRTISKRHVIRKNVCQGFLTESFDVVCVKIFLIDGNTPVREEEMTCDWVWTIADESLPVLSHTGPRFVDSGTERSGATTEWFWTNSLVRSRGECLVSGFIGALLMGCISYYWHNYRN